MNKIAQWHYTYTTEITWFLIGWLSLAALEAFSNENYVSAIVDVALATLNYQMSKSRV